MLNIPVWQLWFMKHSGYDVLILPAPIWVSYEPQERIIGRQIKWLQTEKENNFKITTRARILVLNSPHNPTSVTYSKEELEDISIIARKHRLIVLSDEIYSALNHSEDITYSPSIAKYYPEGTIVLTGISKWCGAGGWRLGALVFPKQMRWLLDASAIIASETYTSVSSPIQYGAIPAFRDFESNEMQEYLHNCNKVLSAIGKRFQYKLTEEAGAFCAKPNGGFYLFPDIEWKKICQSGAVANHCEMGLMHQQIESNF